MALSFCFLLSTYTGFFFRCFHSDILKSTCKRPHYSIPIFKTQDGGSISQICFYILQDLIILPPSVFPASICYKWNKLFYFNGNSCFLTTSIFCFCSDLNRSLLLSGYLALGCYLGNLRIAGDPGHFFTDSLCRSQICF